MTGTSSRGSFGLERRAEVRARALLAGKIVVMDGHISTDCTVIDSSENGARVRLPASVLLRPPLGLLLIRDGVFFDAEMAWRRSDEAGLAFTARHDLETDTDRSLKVVRTLWAQLRPRSND